MALRAITSETWKETYLDKLNESRKTGKTLSEICEADPIWMKSHKLDMLIYGAD